MCFGFEGGMCVKCTFLVVSHPPAPGRLAAYLEAQDSLWPGRASAVQLSDTGPQTMEDALWLHLRNPDQGGNPERRS